MIDGLKLTMAGAEIRKLIDERIDCHRRSIERWRRELARTAEEQTDENPVLPDHICENEIDEHEWRIEVLEFIRDHVKPTEVYRLAEGDLAFGELLTRKTRLDATERVRGKNRRSVQPGAPDERSTRAGV
jgi:hypothetical protein